LKVKEPKTYLTQVSTKMSKLIIMPKITLFGKSSIKHDKKDIKPKLKCNNRKLKCRIRRNN